MSMSGTFPGSLAGKPAKLAILVLAALLSAGCSSSSPDRPTTRVTTWGFPYRADVQQGNWVTQDQIAMLRVGMTREQVRFALGSPTLINVLRADRWDYPYFFKLGSGGTEERQFTVWFENDQLARWSGDEQPALQPYQLKKAKDAGTAGAAPAAATPAAPAPAAEAPAAATPAAAPAEPSSTPSSNQ